MTETRKRDVSGPVFSVIRFLDLDGQWMFGAVQLILFFWDCPSLDFVDVSPWSLVGFLGSRLASVTLSVRGLSGPVVDALKAEIASFPRPWFYGRLLLSHFVATPYILYLDADIWMVKPWLMPLARFLSWPNQTHRLYFAGRDRGLLDVGNIPIIRAWGIQPDFYANDGFWVLRNVPEGRSLKAAAVDILKKNPNMPWYEQTALNLAFGPEKTGLLPVTFEKWHFMECKPWTINCHGKLPGIEAEAGRSLDQEYQKWRRLLG